jgi:hypothetical protein
MIFSVPKMCQKNIKNGVSRLQIHETYHLSPWDPCLWQLFWHLLGALQNHGKIMGKSLEKPRSMEVSNWNII